VPAQPRILADDVTAEALASLLAAQAVHPHLEALVADMSTVDGREALAAHISAAMPELDLLVQNAGVQRRISRRSVQP